MKQTSLKMKLKQIIMRDSINDRERLAATKNAQSIMRHAGAIYAGYRQAAFKLKKEAY